MTVIVVSFIVMLDLTWRAAFIIVAVVLAAPGILVAVKTDTDGVWNPPSHFQRYRGDEYPASKPFFQWWYFSLKDYETGDTLAFCYSMSRTVEHPANTGAYLLFARVGPGGRCHIYYKYPLDAFVHANDFDIRIGDAFSLTATEGDGGMLRLKLQGRMDRPGNAWVAEGIGKDATIAWDMEVTRIAGWYGQQDIEPAARALATISWNTYAYDAEVHGTVSVNDQEHRFSRAPRFRMYCDMNWGERFPSHRSPAVNQIEYPWGWYYTGVPAADPAKDVAIIAGAGRSHSTSRLLGVMNAKFASIYLRGERWSARLGHVQDKTPGKGPVALRTSPDGTCKAFTIERSAWITFTDAFGSAEIPMVQVVTIETSTWKVVMRFESQPGNYNRLLFPTDGYCFSDFEALGVHCTTTVHRKQGRSWQLVETLHDECAGLEYGYKVDVVV